MNKRIEELALQAGYKPLHGFDFANTLEETYLKKFAVLLIEECAELNRKQSYNIMGVLVDMAEPNAEFDRVCLNTVNHVQAYLSGDALKQHFGVEE
jgi:hypothetical protein